MQRRGWLFDLYPSEKGITLWVIDEDGGKTKGYARFTPHFFMHVKESERRHVENIAGKLRCTVSKNGYSKPKFIPVKNYPS